MRIGIDIDGCIRDVHDKLIQVYKRELDQDFHWIDPVEKWRVYNLDNNSSLGVDLYPFWFQTHAEEIYTKSLPFPGYKNINNLHEVYGHDLIVITDQPNWKTAEYTVKWINEYLNVQEIHFTSNKYLITCDLYLDDAPHNIKDFMATGLDYVIMTRPWNEDDPDLNHAVRVKNLNEFNEFILNW